jgi:H+/gluconate symporter-like permease
MDPLLAFLAVIILVSLVIPRLGPFLSLVISAILFGLLAGMGQEMIHAASRRSGVILLGTLCGTGAFGYAVAQSGLGEEIYVHGQFLPLLVLPFLISLGGLTYLRSLLLADQEHHRREHGGDGEGIHPAPQPPGPGGLWGGGGLFDALKPLKY